MRTFQVYLFIIKNVIIFLVLKNNLKEARFMLDRMKKFLLHIWQRSLLLIIFLFLLFFPEAGSTFKNRILITVLLVFIAFTEHKIISYIESKLKSKKEN